MGREEARRLARLQLGDQVERAMKAVGAHQAVKEIERRTGWRCGCARRKAWLNRF
jgi:hypothetical protein